MSNEPSEPTSRELQAPNGTRVLLSRIRQWPRSRQVSLGVVVLLSLAVFAFLIFQARTADYQLLYADLRQAEASSVVKWLDAHNVPYELRKQGQSIYIPADQVYKTRLDLAGDGLPQGHGVGFEIFDKQRFGVTQFTQEVNYQRALQGELARSVATLDPVRSARVHLVLPEKQFLREKPKQAKASVVVEFEQGQRLAQSQIQGIIRLVSGSVEGLQAGQVTVVDEQGQVLSGGGQIQQNEETLSQENLEYKRGVEKSLEQRAQALLDRVFGPRKAMVRVTAEINFVQERTTEELYDPDSLVPRSEKTSERVEGRPPGGKAGVASNLNGEGTGTTELSESTETINYEMSRTVKEINKDIGGLNSLSVAVLLDKQFLSEEQAAAEGGQTVESVRRLVSSALGLSPERGDVIEVVAMPLQERNLANEGTSSSSHFHPYSYFPLIKYILIFLGILLLYIFLVRPIISTLKGEVVQHYKTVSEMEGELQRAIQDPTEQLRQEIARSEVTPAQIVKAWLKDK